MLVLNGSRMEELEFSTRDLEFYHSGDGPFSYVDDAIKERNASIYGSLPEDTLFGDLGDLSSSLESTDWVSEKADLSSVVQGSSYNTIPSLEDVLEEVCPTFSPDGAAAVMESELGSPVSVDELSSGSCSPTTAQSIEELLEVSGFGLCHEISSSSSPPSPLLRPNLELTMRTAAEPSAAQTMALNEPRSPPSPVSDPNPLVITRGPEKSSRVAPYTKVANKRQRTEEQRSRKRQQNRDAALRYRSKKKDELQVLMVEADKLEEVNKGLREKVLTVTKEIEYLKNLMLDVIRARLTQKKL